VIDFGEGFKISQGACPDGGLQCTCDDLDETKPLAQLESIAFARQRERKIGKAGVLTGDGPGGLAASGKVDKEGVEAIFECASLYSKQTG